MDTALKAEGLLGEASSSLPTSQAQQISANPGPPPGQNQNGFETPVKSEAGRTPHSNFERMLLTPGQKGSPLQAAIVGASVVPVPVMQGIRVLIEEKERELMGLSERRMRVVSAEAKSLAEDLRRKEAETATLHSQLAQLTSDFNYNLKLLDERDAELEKQDQELAGFKARLSEQELEAGEFRRGSEGWRAEAEKGQRRVGELEKAVLGYQEVVTKVRGQLEDAKRLRDEEVAKQASEAGVLKAHLAELSAQHEAESAAAVQQAENGFQSERDSFEKRLAKLQTELAESADRERAQTQRFEREVERLKEGLREGFRAEMNERVMEEREKGRRELESLRRRIDEMTVKEHNAEARHTAEFDLLERKLGAEYQAALLTLQEKHGADVSMRERAHQTEREAAEGARLTLEARVESAEREARSAGVKWEERVRALQEERKHGDQRTLALQERVAELEEVTSSQARELETLTSAHAQEAESTRQQSAMLQALVDDLHVALQNKEGEARDLRRKLEELENAKAATVAALERDRAEAESALRQQLLADYESKLGELLDTLRTMKEHVASENDENVRKLDEEIERHRNETEALRGSLEASEHKCAELEHKRAELKIAFERLREENAREKEDAQFVKSTLAARDAEVHLLRGEVEGVQKEVKLLSQQRATWQQTESLRMERLRTEKLRTEGLRTEEGAAGKRAELPGSETGNPVKQDLEFREPNGAAAGLGVGDADGSSLLRKLAAENEELRRQLAAARNPDGLGAGLGKGFGTGLGAERKAEEDRIGTGSKRDGSWALREFAGRTGVVGTRQKEGYGRISLENSGFEEGGFGEERGFQNGVNSPTVSAEVADLYEEVKAVRRSVEALRAGHVADGEGAKSDRGHVAVGNVRTTDGLQNGVSQFGRLRAGRGVESRLGNGIDVESRFENGLENGLLREQVTGLWAELSAIRKEILAVDKQRTRAADRRRNLGLASLGEEENGLGLLQDELSELKSLVRDLAVQPERGAVKKSEAHRFVGDAERGTGVSTVAEKGQKEEGDRGLGDLHGVVASLRAELENLRRAQEGKIVTWQTDSPFHSAQNVDPQVTSRVREQGLRFELTQLRDLIESNPGGLGTPSTPGESNTVASNPVRRASGTGLPVVSAADVANSRVTSGADVAADVGALWEVVSQLRQEFSVRRSEAAHGPDSALEERFRFISAGMMKDGKGGPLDSSERHQMSQAIDAPWLSEKGAANGPVDGVVQDGRKADGVNMNGTGAESNRTDLGGSALAPSALLQREIADVRAELVAFRNANRPPERLWAGNKRTPLIQTEQNGTEHDGKGAQRSSMCCAGSNNPVERDGTQCGVEFSGGRLRDNQTGLGRGFETGRGLSRPPLLTWTDLASCLEESENELGMGRVTSADGSGNITGHFDTAFQRRSTSSVRSPIKPGGGAVDRGLGYKQSLLSSGRNAGPPSGAVNVKSVKSGPKALPRMAVKGSVKEKQNKVNHASKPNWSASGAVFQVVKK